MGGFVLGNDDDEGDRIKVGIGVGGCFKHPDILDTKGPNERVDALIDLKRNRIHRGEGSFQGSPGGGEKQWEWEGEEFRLDLAREGG